MGANPTQTSKKRLTFTYKGYIMQKYEVTVADNGDITWYQNGKLHRLDGPALERVDGDKFWYQNGKLHRLDGPAIEEYLNGDKAWYQNGLLHRLDGPAIEYLNGDKFWFQNGLLHRLDGPAIEYANGKCSWYIADVKYSEVEFNQKINPPKEMTVAELEKILGYPIKIVKD